MATETDVLSQRPLSQETYHIIAFIYAILALVAFILNSLVLFTFSRDRSLFLPTNLLVLSISVADWLMAVVANPVGVAANASDTWSLNSKSCVFYAFITTTLGFAAMLHHTAIAVERFLTVTRPYMATIPNKVMITFISMIWAFAFLWALFPLLGWSAYVPEGGNTSCSLRWQSSDVKDACYIYTIFTCFFFLPIVVIILAYSLLYRNVKWMSVNAVKVWGPNAGPTLEIINAQAKTAKMSSLMTAAFLAGWSPYAVLSLYAAAGNAESISPLLAAVPSMMAKTATAYNPIIYFFMYDRFKVSLKKSVRKLLGRNAVAPIMIQTTTPASQANQRDTTRDSITVSYEMHLGAAWNSAIAPHEVPELTTTC